MTTKDPNHNSELEKSLLDNWMPVIIPVLKARWSRYATVSPPDQQPPPTLANWLSLLHAAATSPWKIPYHLSQLLNDPQDGVSLQRSWVILTRLFELTFEATQLKQAQLEAHTWPALLKIQNRILKTAATLSLVKKNRPSTTTLNRRANFLQATTHLNKKLTTIQNLNELLDEVVYLIQKNFEYEYVQLFLLEPMKQILQLQSAIWNQRYPKTEELFSIPVDGDETAAQVVMIGQPIWVNDFSKEEEYIPYSALPEVKAQMSVPLITGQNLVGVLDVGSDVPNIFSKDEAQDLQDLANRVAVAIENTHLQQTIERYAQQQKLLYENDVALGSNLDTETVLNLMPQKIVETMEVGACTICQINKKNQTITALTEYVLRYPGHPAHTWRELNEPIPIEKDNLGHRVLKTGRPVIDQANELPKYWQHSAQEKNQKWGTILMLPLTIKRRLTGLIEIYDKNPYRYFSPDEIRFCQFLAKQTALAIERAQLFSETRQRLNEVATLYTMAQKISGNLDLQVTLDDIVTSLRDMMGCRGCCIFLLDPHRQRLEIKAAAGLKPQWRHMAKLQVGEGAAGQAVATGKPIYIPDTHQDPDFIFFDKEVRSLVVIPLSAHGEIIGTINVDDDQPNAFGPTQEKLLTIAAAQAGIAIDNARLFTKVLSEQQQINAIIQNIGDGLLVIDQQGYIVTCNPTLAEMVGMYPDQIVGQNVNGANLHPDLKKITSAISSSSQASLSSEEIIIETVPSKIVKVFAKIMVDEKQNPLGEVRVVHDVTQERHIEQLKNDFLSSISHELRTPLFSIQGFIQILLNEDSELDQKTRRDYLATIQKQATELSEMVNNLLDISKFDEEKLDFEQKPINMLDIIHQTVLKLQGFAHQHDSRIVTQMPPSLPTVQGDTLRLEQVLMNLIGNAIKFTEEEVILSASISDGELWIKIKDDGMGIPADSLEQIFAKYYQVRDAAGNSHRGTGLGLHIAKKIVEGHQGRIWAESTVGEGTMFYFTLPCPEPAKKSNNH